ncbi:MAG: hypothetical protein ABMA64_03505 [Myxococcota bacterium]
MVCGGCGSAVGDGARFCASCGAPVPEERPGAVAEYRAALASLGGRTEAWAVEELRALRAELQIRGSTHERLLAELDTAAAAAPVSLWLDATPLEEFRSGEQCLLRWRVVNESGRALLGVELAVSTTAAPERGVDRSPGALGPGEEQVLSVLFRAGVAGQHHADGSLEIRPMRGDPVRWAIAPVPFQIGAAAALAQSIHIDARAQRVGIFENIGAASRGGLVGRADWHRVALRPEVATAPAPTERATGIRGTGRVVAVGPELTVSLDGAIGVLVELADPGLRAVLRPGDALTVSVIGHDAAGRPLLTDRAGAPIAQAPSGPSGQVVGPGDDLVSALAAAAPRATLRISGTHTGPFTLDRPVTLEGDGAELRAGSGPVVRISADVVLRGLRIAGAAPAGAYAADAVEVVSGRVALERCELSADAPGNLVPGRALAVTGPATVELDRCDLSTAGLGVAVDVSWTGFATDTARGARVVLRGGVLRDLQSGVAIAGGDRGIHLVGVAVERVAHRLASVSGGASATFEDMGSDRAGVHADPGTTVVWKGSGR